MFKMRRSIGRIWWDALGFRDITRHVGVSGINVTSDQPELIVPAVGGDLTPISKSTERRKQRSVDCHSATTDHLINMRCFGKGFFKDSVATFFTLLRPPATVGSWS